MIFEDIRFEYTRRQLQPVYQSDMSAPYCPGKELDNISITAEDGVDIPGIVLQGVNAFAEAPLIK